MKKDLILYYFNYFYVCFLLFFTSCGKSNKDRYIQLQLNLIPKVRDLHSEIFQIPVYDERVEGIDGGGKNFVIETQSNFLILVDGIISSKIYKAPDIYYWYKISDRYFFYSPVSQPAYTTIFDIVFMREISKVGGIFLDSYCANELCYILTYSLPFEYRKYIISYEGKITGEQSWKLAVSMACGRFVSNTDIFYVVSADGRVIFSNGAEKFLPEIIKSRVVLCGRKGIYLSDGLKLYYYNFSSNTTEEILQIPVIYFGKQFYLLDDDSIITLQENTGVVLFSSEGEKITKNSLFETCNFHSFAMNDNKWFAFSFSTKSSDIVVISKIKDFSDVGINCSIPSSKTFRMQKIYDIWGRNFLTEVPQNNKLRIIITSKDGIFEFDYKSQENSKIISDYRARKSVVWQDKIIYLSDEQKLLDATGNIISSDVFDVDSDGENIVWVSYSKSDKKVKVFVNFQPVDLLGFIESTYFSAAISGDIWTMISLPYLGIWIGYGKDFKHFNYFATMAKFKENGKIVIYEERFRQILEINPISGAIDYKIPFYGNSSISDIYYLWEYIIALTSDRNIIFIRKGLYDSYKPFKILKNFDKIFVIPYCLSVMVSDMKEEKFLPCILGHDSENLYSIPLFSVEFLM